MTWPKGLRRSAVWLVALALTAGGCYNPKIKPGGLKCNQTFTKFCPDGFACDQKTQLCYPTGFVPDAAVEARPDVSEVRDAVVDLPKEVAPPIDTAPACLTPVSTCTPRAGLTCDPVCQSGCGCNTKCAVSSTNVFTCNAPFNNTRTFLKTEDPCQPFLLGTADQTDACQPGDVCLEDGCNDRCYHYCATDADCPTSKCSVDAGGGMKVCELKFQTCNPIRNIGESGCATTGMACYLSPTYTDKRICDCPFMTVGEGEPCKRSRDCFAGFVCVDPTSSNAFVCRRACATLPLGYTCQGGPGRCTLLNGSPTYGFCN
jgi:hypothetical protein